MYFIRGPGDAIARLAHACDALTYRSQAAVTVLVSCGW